MQYISSTSNPLIKTLNSLKDNQTDIVIVEGIKIIREVINNNLQIEKILLTEQKYEEYKSELDFDKYDTYIVSEHIIKNLSSTKTPQGIVASVQFKDIKLVTPSHNFLVLDNIQDPGNLGTIIRTALGANYLDLYLINCVNYKSPKVLRSTMGAIFGLNIYKLSQQELISMVKDNNLELICTNLNGTNIYDFEPKNDLYGLAIGNEGNGLSKELIDLASQKITIPMNPKLESLNAGVSAGIAMYILNYKKGAK